MKLTGLSLNIYNYLLTKNKSHVVFDKNKNAYLFYVEDKIFAIINNSFDINQLTLRVPPKLYEELQCYNFIIPSYEYMDSYNWKSFFFEKIDSSITKAMIDIAYDMAIEKMTKKQKFKYLLDYSNCVA